jgi:hypothetical protein
MKTLAHLLAVLGFVGFAACVPPGAGPDTTTPTDDQSAHSAPTCDVHGHPFGDGCTCDAGYSGDGIDCTEDVQPAPSCDVHGHAFGSGCSCDGGYSGDGFTCTADQ